MTRALNTEFVAAVGMLRKKLNHHTKAGTFSKKIAQLFSRKKRFLPDIF